MNDEWDTADVKSCDHGYVFLEACTKCGGSGEMKVPQIFRTCRCCQGREKIRPCKKCNGSGIEDAIKGISEGEFNQGLNEVANNILKAQKSTDPEFEKMMNKHYLDFLV